MSADSPTTASKPPDPPPPPPPPVESRNQERADRDGLRPTPEIQRGLDDFSSRKEAGQASGELANPGERPTDKGMEPTRDFQQGLDDFRARKEVGQASGELVDFSKPTRPESPPVTTADEPGRTSEPEAGHRDDRRPADAGTPAAGDLPERSDDADATRRSQPAEPTDKRPDLGVPDERADQREVPAPIERTTGERVAPDHPGEGRRVPDAAGDRALPEIPQEMPLPGSTADSPPPGSRETVTIEREVDDRIVARGADPDDRGAQQLDDDDRGDDDRGDDDRGDDDPAEIDQDDDVDTEHDGPEGGDDDTGRARKYIDTAVTVVKEGAKEAAFQYVADKLRVEAGQVKDVFVGSHPARTAIEQRIRKWIDR